MSFESDPPAVTQPTLPPPPVREALHLGHVLPRRRTKLVGGVAVAAAAFALGGYGLFASHESDASTTALSAATLTIAQTGDVASRFDKMFDSFPSEQNETVCQEEIGAPRIPMVLYSAFEASRLGKPINALEASLFVTALSLANIHELPHTPSMDRLGSSSRVAILKTLDLTEPHGSHGAPTGGRFEAVLAVFGARKAGETKEVPLCQTRIVAWSSASVLEPGVPERTVRDDYMNRIQAAVADAAQRMHVQLDL